MTVSTLTTESTAHVVVGVDGSESSLAAVRLAAREAALRDRPLRVVHAFDWDQYDLTATDGGLRRLAEQLTEEAMVLATETAPGLQTSVAVVEGSLIAALLHESRTAALIVLGDGGLASYTCLPIDTPAVQVAARAGCCVLIGRHVPEVNHGPEVNGPILVGVDGSAGSERALGFGFDAAASRGVQLVVVQVCDTRAATGAGVDLDARLAETMAPWQEKYPGVAARHRALRGEPAAVLLDESAAADFVVVARRGETPSRGVGSVCQAVLHRSPRPAVIVPGASGAQAASR